MAGFVTGEAAREQASVLLEQIDAAQTELRQLSTEEAGTAFRLRMAERLETQQRVNRGLMYRVVRRTCPPT